MTLELRELGTRAAEVVAVDIGEPVVLTHDGVPAAKLQPVTKRTNAVRKLGLVVGRGTCFLAPDFKSPMTLVEDPDAVRGERPV